MGPLALALLVALTTAVTDVPASATSASRAGDAPTDTAPASTPSALRLTEAIETYDVRATTLADFVATMQRRKAGGEGDWPGRTTATLAVRYRLVPVDDGCRAEDMDIALDVVIRLPRWEPADAVRPAIRDQWERMKTGIRTHENGHRDIAVAAASRLADRLAAFVPAAGQDCAAVDRRILRERIKAQMSHQNLDRAYDRRTRHGLTQVPKAGEPRRRDTPTAPAAVTPRTF